MRIPVQWATGTNASRSKAANCSRLINMYPEALPPDSKAPVVLYGTPGTQQFALLPGGPILGLHVMNYRLYAVTPTHLYEIYENGTYKQIGNVNLERRASMANNGYQLVIVDGKRGYWHEEDTDEVHQFDGDGWYPSDAVAYQDGYFIFNRAGTGQFFISQLLSVEFNAIDFATAEGSPDDAVHVVSKQRELWIFGTDSIEVWYNSGSPDFPFDRLQGAFIERGTDSPQSVVKLDDSLFFLGADGMVYRTQGYQPVRISTHGMEYDIAKGRIDDAFAWGYVAEGHTFYVITFPAQKKTWCYDVATGIWHERQHYQWGHDNALCYARFAGRHLIGDFQSGMIHDLTMNSGTNNGDPIQRVAISPPVQAGKVSVSQSVLELDMETGVGLPVGQGDNPQAMLQWSDDNGNTWSNERWATLGKVGEYRTRVRFFRLGMFRERVFKLVISDPVPVAILSAYAEVQSGRS